MRSIKSSGLVLTAMAILAMTVGASVAFGASEYKTSGSFPVTFTGKSSKASRFESTGKNYVECEKSSSKGEVKSAKEALATVTYEGKCKVEGVFKGSCEEPIVTKVLKVEPGDKLGPATGGSKVGVLFKPAEGELLAEPTCEGHKLPVKGQLVCENPKPGVSSTSGSVVCKKTGPGTQEFTEIEVFGTKLTKQELKAEATVLGFKITEKDAQETSEELTYSKAVEQTS